VLKIHDVFHVDHLSPYKGNNVNGLLPPPPDPITVDGEEEYEVDHIRDSKVFGQTLKYLVRWKGYGEGEDTWEPAKNLANAKAKVDEFHVVNPGTPRKIATLIHASLPWQSPTVFTSANADVQPLRRGVMSRTHVFSHLKSLIIRHDKMVSHGSLREQ
jgi:hypothetical protein